MNIKSKIDLLPIYNFSFPFCSESVELLLYLQQAEVTIKGSYLFRYIHCLRGFNLDGENDKYQTDMIVTCQKLNLFILMWQYLASNHKTSRLQPNSIIPIEQFGLGWPEIMSRYCPEIMLKFHKTLVLLLDDTFSARLRLD